jgi:tetratricopeptide (TPR) repeat protein
MMLSMASLTRLWRILMLYSSMLLLASQAGAEDEVSAEEEQGRALAVEAMAHYKSGEYHEALEKFDEARAVYPSGQVLRMSGYTLMALGRWLEAADRLEEALDNQLKPLSPQDGDHANAQLRKVLEHIAVVTVTSTVAGATASIDDGEERMLPTTVRLDPGKHGFVVSAADRVDARVEQDLGAGERTTLTLDPELPNAEPRPLAATKPRPEPEPEDGDAFGWFPGQGPLGLVMAGAGIVAGGVALGLGIHGLDLRDAVQENIDAHQQNYDAECRDDSELCRYDITLINRDGERAADFQNAAMVTGIVALGLFAVGTTFFLMSDDSPLAPDDGGDELALACGPWMAPGLGCAGSF